MIGVVEKCIEIVTVLCVWDPSLWYNLGSLKECYLLPGDLSLLEHWLPWRPRVLFMSFEMIAQKLWCHFAAILKRKNALLNFDCDPWIGSPYSQCFLPHTPFSCCSPVCSLTLKSRTSCDRLAILNGMGWEGTKAKLLWHFSLLCACLLHSLKSNLKDSAKFDLSLILSGVFIFIFLSFFPCGKQCTTQFIRRSLKCHLVLNSSFTVVTFYQPSNLYFSVRCFSLD